MINKVQKFFNDVYQEMSKVGWPSRDELIGSTTVVVVMSIIVSIFTGDFLKKDERLSFV